MFNINDIKNGMTVQYDGNIYLVLDFQHVKPGKGPAFVRTKMKNLRTKAITDITFNTNVKLEKAHISKQAMQFLYTQGQEYTFMDLETYDQMEIPEKNISDIIKYLKEGLTVDIIMYQGEIIDIELPEKIEMLVVQADPAVKGNTAQAAQKDATLETGLVVQVPLFIETGETIVISTKDGKYKSRA